ncbi:hypothetical protein DENIS_0734 [Desulfonema ishimotonii]|uniref:Molybdopterin oxidoreductase n=1 Tax=Desulfonema ishimotonii TaxID=45657 RepID=A0A401FS66_9BACT|nr:4Fe-4S dicluster domain-containing protein [Desulfonema ishimotonii]GBC59793.1 hypothetical protein DENIS_0734 [Desulfonema ishimotonii]
MDRRTFLKIAGIGSLSVATGCSSDADKNLYSLVQAPDDMVTGKAAWYASTCRECPAGCGVIARNREGRVVKLEGNPLHPVNRGKLCMRGQAALQGVYNPDRLTKPLIRSGDRWQAISCAEAEAMIAERAADAEGKTRLLTEVVGDPTLDVMSDFLKTVKSPAPLMFEPYAYESLKTANKLTFGVDGLCAYHIQDADLLLCFGADFLETWLSPVEYARKFKEMHGYRDGRKGLFFHVSPWQSLTAANADQWFACAPGAEAAVVLGCIRESLSAGKGGGLPEDIRSSLWELSDAYTPETVAELSGIAPDAFKKLTAHLIRAEKPLVLGQGMAGSGRGALQTNVAANLLNLVLDPSLSRIDFVNRHRVERAARRSEIDGFFKGLEDENVTLLLLNNVNPVFALPATKGVAETLARASFFTVSFSNFMDEASAHADLIFPVRLPIERWGEYSGKGNIVSTLQPAMGDLTGAPALCEVLMRVTPSGSPGKDAARTAVYDHLLARKTVQNPKEWLLALQRGGVFDSPETEALLPDWDFSWESIQVFEDLPKTLRREHAEFSFIAAPSLRFFDGRGANKPWLSELPDPLTKVAWQSPVLMHPDTLSRNGIRTGDLLEISTDQGNITAPAYGFPGMRPEVLVMAVGQGRETYGRYAKGYGSNPLALLPDRLNLLSGGPDFAADSVRVRKAGKRMALAHTDGSKTQHGRKIALSVGLHDLSAHDDHARHAEGFAMHDFPMTLPLPEGYEPHRDLYPPHEHQDGYRWGMVVDLDRCIGCGACSVACYAENNIGVVGEERIIGGREMSWIRIERYHDPENMNKIIFLPMMCQHCDNAPCESVCPVYAPHHGKEGMNNQIYNRCIGTRYCAQNCPYKVRRFNWFEWDRPAPLPLQLNPDVTVRMKGVMEKCSFCIQRVKAAHGIAKNENRRITDGEVLPACVQTCPTGALVFGNLADKNSRVRQMADDRRAYQVMGYLNTKTAVIYLKKVVQEV